ncbi:MAG: hypothetical protein KatS3mg110_0457 [Pirellulaceae bacterium]|nr:MAG: hypothetical protein KatS3mg110_0457 [Pirellulaceae bacterium]
MTFLVNLLYVASNLLLAPVVVGLLGLSLLCCLQIGGTAREWYERQRVTAKWAGCQSRLAAGHIPRTISDLGSSVRPGLVRLMVRRMIAFKDRPDMWEKELDDMEIFAAGRLARLALLSRVGPMLGLMGTLIPLGPAINALVQADWGNVSRQLLVAFTTTVLGLFIGGVAHAIWVVRQHWYSQDLADIEFLVRILSKNRPLTEQMAHDVERMHERTF